MRKHNIFTLGIILSCIYGINAMADWPTITATNIWTNSGHTTLANKRCSDCCKTDCWLPNGTYYDTKGMFIETCGLSCPSGQYDIGFGKCISASTNGTAFGSWDYDGYKIDTGTYGLTGVGQWATKFSYGVVKGMASCNGIYGPYPVATDKEFSPTANGTLCWCKMTSPSVSRWVFVAHQATENNCKANCAWACATRSRDLAEVRTGIFGSVAGTTPRTCDANRIYSNVNSVCTAGGCSAGMVMDANATCRNKLSCPSGAYDIGFNSCIEIGVNGSGFGTWDFDEASAPSDGNTYGLKNPGTWYAKLYTGDTIIGVASCNSTSGSSGQTSTADFQLSVTGQYCWCKMISPVASLWVFSDDKKSQDLCNSSCALECAAELHTFAEIPSHQPFQSNLFGSIHW